jgi:hypothetical protein
MGKNNELMSQIVDNRSEFIDKLVDLFTEDPDRNSCETDYLRAYFKEVIAKEGSLTGGIIDALEIYLDK